MTRPDPLDAPCLAVSMATNTPLAVRYGAAVACHIATLDAAHVTAGRPSMIGRPGRRERAQIATEMEGFALAHPSHPLREAVEFGYQRARARAFRKERSK